MPRKKTDRDEQQEVSFESSMRQLQEILSDLESGNLSLSDSLAKYESGVGHLAACQKFLTTARSKIELLTAVDENGQIISQPYDAEATMDKESSRPPAKKKRARKKVMPKEDDTDDDADSDGLF